MKIVHYLSEIVLAHGGVVRSVLDLTAALAKAGHEVHILCFDDTDVPAAWKQGGPLAPKSTKLGWPERPKAFRRFSKEDRLRAEGIIAGARALHLHGPWEATNPQLAAIASSRSVPYVVSIHGMLDDWTIAQGKLKKRLYLRFAGRKMLEDASCVLCTAEAERAQSSKWFRNPGTVVLPLLFDLAPFRERLEGNEANELLAKVPGSAPAVLFLSRLHPKKGLEHLIDASAELHARAVPHKLLIAGTEDHQVPGYEQSLRARIAARGIQAHTAFLGLVTGPAKVALLSAARVSVLPTSQENWGFSLLESLAAGTPIITTRGVDIWSELEASGGAIICGQSARELAPRMELLIKDAPLARRMGDDGRAWAYRELDPGRVLGRYEELYRGLRAPIL